MIRLAGLVAESFLAAAPAVADVRVLDWSDLDGWSVDDHEAARDAFRSTSDLVRDPRWQPAIRASTRNVPARRYFEEHFRPVSAGPDGGAFFTGYYEPELDGSLRPSARFSVPIHRLPDDRAPGRTWPTREEIDAGALDGRGLEIAWLSDPVDRFLLQVQGSGRIRLAEGGTLRVGYAGSNGHPYRSVGEELIRRGVVARKEMTAERIRQWIAQGADRERLLWHNPSYAFFREIDLPGDIGPLGAMERPVVAGRSVAVDPAHVPLGAPVWIETDGPPAMARLMTAHDTGSAIKGPNRADLFFGTGPEAGRLAGGLRHAGRMAILVPVEALPAFPEGQ